MAQSIDNETASALPAASPAEIAAARFYEQQLVPALFRQYAPRLADAAGVAGRQQVLDVACGTGVVTRELAARLAPGTIPVGVDIAPGMLAVARDTDPALDWRHGDARSLPFADASFDRVVCAFGLMFFADPVEALAEMLRVLKPGGRLAVSVWDSISNNPGSAALVDILQRLAGSDAADALRMPFRSGDRGDLQRRATAAGLAGIEIETQPGRSHYPRMQVLIDAELRGWLPIMGVRLEESLIAAIEAESGRRLQEFVDPGDGAFRSPTSAHILRGRREK